jgi:hypothetical protein
LPARAWQFAEARRIIVCGDKIPADARHILHEEC